MPIQWQVPVALAWIECLTVNKLESIMATIKIKQIKSKIGAPIDQKRTLLIDGGTDFTLNLLNFDSCHNALQFINR